jgi:hypothetical protein
MVRFKHFWCQAVHIPGNSRDRLYLGPFCAPNISP